MKKIAIVLLILTATLGIAQTPNRAPEYAQCLADYRLWRSERTSTESNKLPAKSLEAEQNELGLCARAYLSRDTPIEAEPAFVALQIQLEGDVSLRMAAFLTRHRLMVTYITVWNEEKARARKDNPDWSDFTVGMYQNMFIAQYLKVHNLDAQFYAEDRAGERSSSQP